MLPVSILEYNIKSLDNEKACFPYFPSLIRICCVSVWICMVFLLFCILKHLNLSILQLLFQLMYLLLLIFGQDLLRNCNTTRPFYSQLTTNSQHISCRLLFLNITDSQVECQLLIHMIICIMFWSSTLYFKKKWRKGTLKSFK